jgi:cell division septation protein DedD
VQAGAFSRRENAEDLVKQLRAKHYAATIIQGRLYRVWIGQALDRREAEQLAEHLRADGFEAVLMPSQ